MALCRVVLACALAVCLATPAVAATAYTKVERCIGLAGSSPAFSRWVGAIDTNPNSVVIIGANPVRLDVNLASGWKRTGQDARTVVVQRLRRSASGVTPELVPSADKVTLTMSASADSYLFEFHPTAAQAPVQSCVLTFGDVWAWAGDTLTYASPLQPSEATFPPGQVNVKPVKDLLSNGMPGDLQQLWIQPLSGDTAVSRYRAGRDPHWSLLQWDGATESYRVQNSAVGYIFWLCSAGMGSPTDAICLPLLQERLVEGLLVVRTKAEVTTTQEMPLRDIAKSHVLVTPMLVGSSSSQTTQSVTYNGEVASLDSPVLRAFAAKEQSPEFTLGVFGSADVEHDAWRCPATVKEPRTNISVFAGSDASDYDVVGCLYERTADGSAWTLVTSPAPGTPARLVMDSFRFSLCSSGVCLSSEPTEIVGQIGFHLNQRTTSASLQVSNTDHPSLVLDLPSDLQKLSVVYPPRLPDAPVVDMATPHVDLASYDRAEWALKKAGACIKSEKAWMDLGVSNEHDGAATLMLRADDTTSPVGNGRWLLETIDGRELLCPQLTDTQVDAMLARIRDTIASGGTAGLYMIQGGRLVGHLVKITGPARPPVTTIQLLVPTALGDQPLSKIRQRMAIPRAHALCVVTPNDMGDRVWIDPTRIVLRDNLGGALLRFESHGAFPFARHGQHLVPADPWVYCAQVVDEAKVPDGDVVVVRRVATPSVEVSSVAWEDTDTEGCGHACGAPIAVERFGASFLKHALSEFHTGLAWGHVLAWEPVPPTEARVFVAAPLAMEEYQPFLGKMTLTAEAGAMIGFSFARNVVAEQGLTSRIALPIGGYAGGCVSATVLRHIFHASPQACFGFALDLITPKTTATSIHSGAQFGVEGFGLTPFMSIGLGQF